MPSILTKTEKKRPTSKIKKLHIKYIVLKIGLTYLLILRILILIPIKKKKIY